MARKPSTRGSGQVLASTELLRIPDDVLARVPDNQPADHLLLANVREEEITVYLPFPLEASLGDGVWLLVDGDLVGGEVIVDPYSENEDDIPLPLPASARSTDGVHAINYQLVLHSGEGQISTGPMGQQFIVDYTVPGAPAPPGSPSIEQPQFAPEVIADAVTSERLTTDADGNTYLPAMVKPYHGQAIGDRLLGYIDGKVATEMREILEGETDDAIEVRYTLAALEELTNGRHGFTVEVVDRAENPPGFSEPVDLMVRLHAVIPNPLPARVPSAIDGLVNYDDAHRPGGVQVDIPANDQVLPGDTIVLTWADYQSDPYPVEAGSEGNDPLLTLFVPYEEVYKAWFATSADTDQRVATEVNYVILRGGEIAGTPDNPTTVDVNLYVSGGGDPDPETPEHEALQAATIYSANGAVNLIPIAEQQLDGIVEVPWDSALPARLVFRLGDILTIRFGATTLVPPHVVNATDITAAKPLRVVLPKEAIATEGTGTVVVSYTIERPLAGGGANIAISPSQDVRVEDQTDLPGGGTLAEGRFTEVNAHLTLGPHEIKGGTEFVGDYADRLAGDTIRFEFQFVAGNAHKPDEVPIAARFHSGTLTLAADLDPIKYQIAEEYLNYHELPPEQMHIHATYHASRGASTEVHSPDTMVYLDCRGAEPPFTIDTSPVQIIGTGTFEREASNGDLPYTYLSSNPGVVEVPDAHVGLIKGVADGTAIVVASDAAGSAKSYPVTVVGNTPFTIDASLVEITGTGTTRRDAAGGVPPYTYASNAPGVVRVPDPLLGLIQGVTDGSATITAHDSAQGTGSYPVIVKGNIPFTIDTSLVQIIGTDTYARHAAGGVPPYTYTSSAPSVVKVTDASQGLIQGVADGSAIITARDGAQGTATYPVTVTGNTPIVLLQPEPDFIEASGRIDIDRITDPRGLRLTVKQYQGMVAGQKITLTCISPAGDNTPAAQDVGAIGDYEFFIPKSYIEAIHAQIDPAIAGLEYTVTAPDVDKLSPMNKVTFYR